MDQLYLTKSDAVVFLTVLLIAGILAKSVELLLRSLASYARRRWTTVGIISSALERLKRLDFLIDHLKKQRRSSESPAPDHCSREDLNELICMRFW